MSGRGEAANAGLVSSSNKGNFSPEEIASKRAGDIATVKRRLSRMQSGVIAAAKYVNNELIGDDDSWRSALITLTYRPDVVWEPGHIQMAIRHYRQWFKRRGIPCRGVWTLEAQPQTGKPHYHIVMWIKKGKLNRPPLPDKQGWWPHGMSNAIFATSPVGYIAKYASKGPGSVLPKGARIWGHFGLDAAGKFEVARTLAPRWLKALVSASAQIKRVEGFMEEARNHGKSAMVKVRGFLDTLTGLIFLSPWIFDGFSVSGLALRHQGFVDCFTSEGDHWRIPTQKEIYA
jgi:hypothetical protein